MQNVIKVFEGTKFLRVSEINGRSGPYEHYDIYFPAYKNGMSFF